MITGNEIRHSTVESFIKEFTGQVCPLCNYTFVREVDKDDGIYYHCFMCDNVFKFDQIDGLKVLEK